MREGWFEMDIVTQKFKTCTGCVHMQSKLIKSGRNPIRENICNFNSESTEYKFKSVLSEKIHGYVKTPGIDGNECPLNDQIIRNNKLNEILK